MAETGKLAPENIIEKKHAIAAFNYIREHGQQRAGIWYYQRTPSLRAWVVDFDGEKYWQRETLKLANLFALKDVGEIKDEEPPFSSGFDKHIRNDWLEYNAMERIWEGMGFTPRSNMDTVGDEHNEEHRAMSIDIVGNGYNLLRRFRQVIFHGPPGTGKTYNAKKVLGKLFGGELPAHGERWNIVQFHPSYNYEDFVRGIKVETHGNQIVYNTINRVFSEMCKRANNDKSNDYALIIDEINRANVSAVLGELIYALEYRGEPIDTPYAIDGAANIVVPENLYIIGTMNTADRTIGQIDYAVRRRFAFLHCPPDRSVICEDAFNLFDKVQDVFGKQYLSPDFHADDVRIGHSYFLEGEDFAYKTLYQVVPMLEEYLKDGVLLPSATDIIEEIRKDAEDLLLQAPGGEETSADEDSEDENSRTSRKQYFYWRCGNDGVRRGVGGIGRVALGVIKDFIQHNPQMDVGAMNDALRVQKRTFIYTEDNLPEDPKGRIRYFKGDSISHKGKNLFVGNQWGDGDNATLWGDFKDKMKSHGYIIGLCHLVNLGEGNGDNPSRTWEDCFKYKIVSGRGVGYPTSIGNLKKGDLLFVRIAESSDKHSGYVACAEVEEEKTHITEVRIEEGELLADTIVGNGQTYRQKYPTAFDEEYPDYAVKVKWIDHKPRNKVIRGISTSVLSFRVSKIQMKDIRTLLTAFNIPSSDK